MTAALRRFCAVTLTLALFTTFTQSSNAQAVVAGAKCPKKGLTALYKDRKFTCISSKGKLIWNSGIQNKVAPKPTPTLTPSPTPTLTPSPTPTTVSDQLNIKNKMIYGLSNDFLTRRSETGQFFSSDSRKPSNFSSTRFKAYEALNPTLNDLSHSNIDITYVVRDSFPKELVPFVKRQFEEAATFWNPYLPKRLSITIYLLTEKDREYTKNNHWLNWNLPAIFNRFDLKNERPFISGGGRYFVTDGVASGRIYLATASYLDLNYVNYEWPQVAKHEFTHVIQDFFYSINGRFGAESDDAYTRVLPTNFMEGSANTVGFLTSFQNIGWASDAMDWVVWQRSRDNSYWMTIKSTSDAVRMMQATEKNSPDSAFEMSYAIGALMFEWVIANYGLKGYLAILNSLADSPSFDETLKRAIGMSQSQFYEAVAPYVLEQINRIGD